MSNKWKPKCLLTDEQIKIYGICTQWYEMKWKKTNHTQVKAQICLENGIQLALEHGTELHGSPYTWIAFSSKHHSTTQSPAGQTRGGLTERNCRNGAPTVSYVWIFWLNGQSVLLTLSLFKDQLYLVREVSHKGFVCMYF